MFQLRDFYHLPELENCLEQMINASRGLMLVAGTAIRTAGLTGAVDVALPSGRATIVNMFFNEIMAAQPHLRAVIIGQDRTSMRLPRAYKGRVRHVEVTGKHTYAALIAAANAAKTGLIVVDQINTNNAKSVMEVAERGRRVLSQLDTPLRGEEVVWHLQQYGVDESQLDALSWIVTVMRLPALCPRCSQPAAPDLQDFSVLEMRYPHLAGLLQSLVGQAFMISKGCQHCKGNGRFGEVSAFDVYHRPATSNLENSNSQSMPMEAYLLRLVAAGRLPLEEVIRFEAQQRSRLYNLASLHAGTVSHQMDDLQRRLVELETANRVLQQRTEQLISLESVGQTLIATDDLQELARQICQRLDALCGADRVLLYYQDQTPSRSGALGSSKKSELEILAVSGWDQRHAGQRVKVENISQLLETPEPVAFRGFPPGIEPGLGGVVADDRARLLAGLSLPLIAHGVTTGLMVVQSTRKRAFLPGERALLQAFANQVALAVQRAGLMHERIQHEKLERELELARQLQQSLLPQTFPDVTGISCMARSRPARWIGGDFYDVFTLENGQLAVVIGDASDKGLPAALYMGLTRSLIRAEARRSDSPEIILRSVNQLLLDLGELRGFISLCLVLIDPCKRRMIISRAGHERPLLIRDGILQHLDGEGMILGILPDTELVLSESQINLQPGDWVVLYSDGLTDVLSERDVFFGEARFYDLLRSATVHQVCDLVFDELDAYRGSAEQYDDMTMVIISVD